MPELENLHGFPVFMDAIVNPNRRVQDFANPGPPVHGRAHVRERSLEIRMIQNRTPKRAAAAGLSLWMNSTIPSKPISAASE